MRKIHSHSSNVQNKLYRVKMEMRSNQNFNGFQALVTVREIKDVNIMLSQSHDQHASGSMLHDLVMHK
jgi:hypothetical protein